MQNAFWPWALAALALLGADSPDSQSAGSGEKVGSIPTPIKPGDRVYVQQPARFAVAMSSPDERTYRAFLWSIRRKDINSFKDLTSRIKGRRSGGMVKVLE